MFQIRRTFLFLAGISLTSAVLAQGFGPAPVVIAEVERRELAPSVDVPGTVVSRFDSSFASELSAKLVWIAEVGTVVKKDETVARLEDFTYKLLEMQAQGRLEGEQARVKFLQSERERLIRVQYETGRSITARIMRKFERISAMIRHPELIADWFEIRARHKRHLDRVSDSKWAYIYKPGGKDMVGQQVPKLGASA